MNILTGFIAQVPCNSLVSYAVAVHNSNVYIVVKIFKQVIERVCSKVTCVCFLLTNKTVIIEVVVKADCSVADNLAKFGVYLGNPFVLYGFYCFVLFNFAAVS